MPMIVLLVAFVVMLPIPVHADLNEDFAVCRRTILQIGSDPRSPADQYCLGLSHAFALNHKKDRTQAATWFRKAADQNHAAAQAVLGYLYERGDGVKADPAEAAKWYRKAADQNYSKEMGSLLDFALLQLLWLLKSKQSRFDFVRKIVCRGAKSNNDPISFPTCIYLVLSCVKTN